MAYGTDLKKAIDAAGKAGLDISDFKNYANVCKDIDKAQALHKVLHPALSDVRKFIVEPDPKMGKIVGQFFRLREEFIDLAKPLYKTIEKWVDVSNGLVKGIAKADKEKIKALDAIRFSCFKEILVDWNPSNSAIFDDFNKMGKKGLKDFIDEAEKTLEKDIKNLLKKATDLKKFDEDKTKLTNAFNKWKADFLKKHEEFVSGKSPKFEAIEPPDAGEYCRV